MFYNSQVQVLFVKQKWMGWGHGVVKKEAGEMPPRHVDAVDKIYS